VFGGLNRLLSVTVVAGALLTAFLVGPAAAAGCGTGTSAVSVYKECQQTGGGGKPSSKSSKGSHQGSGSVSAKTKTQHLSSNTQKALDKSGKDKKALAKLVKSYGLGRQLQTVGGGSTTTTPSAVGSAFDLSSGPTALLIVLAGTAILLLGGSGMRVWRTRRRA
jgi:hypothetical protein